MAPDRKMVSRVPVGNSFPRISRTTPGKELLEELTKCENCVSIATYADNVVKTQCTYTLDSPLSPGGLFINLSTFLAVSLDALPLDCLLRNSAGGGVEGPAEAASCDALRQQHTPAQKHQRENLREKESTAEEKVCSSGTNSSNENGSRKSSSSAAGGGVLVFHPRQRLYVHVRSSVDGDQAASIGRALASRRKKDVAAEEDDAAARTAAAGASISKTTAGAATAAPSPDTSRTYADGGSEEAAERKPVLPTKLALGVEGGFPLEDKCTSGDACPAALGRTFQYCLAVLPQQLRAPAARFTSAAASAAASSSYAAAAASSAATEAGTPLSLYSRCTTSCMSNSSSSSEEMTQLLHAQEVWEEQLLQQITFLPLDSPGIPEKIRVACNAVVEHRGSSAPVAAAAADGAVAWEEPIKVAYHGRNDAAASLCGILPLTCMHLQRRGTASGGSAAAASHTLLQHISACAQVSKYAATLEQISNPPSIGPTGWRCVDCGATTNLWLNLSDGHIGCGRKLYGIGGGCLDGREGAAIRHYIATGERYPLIVKLGTILPHSADVYSYAPDEDCCVIDPLLPEHLAHFGVHIQQLTKTEKSTNELALDWNVQHEWSRATEADTQLRQCSGADFVGLRNLGNSCYINSVVQVLTSIPELREKYVSLFPVLLASLPVSSSKGGCSSSSGEKTGAMFAAVDFLLQHSSLAVALHTNRYPLQDRRRKAAIIRHAKELSTPPNSSSRALRAREDVEEADEVFKCVSYLDTDSVTPQLYRHLVGTQHAEFATLHQQDAEEFMSMLLQWLGCRDTEASSRLEEAKRRLDLAQNDPQQQGGEEEIAVVAAAGCTSSDALRAERALEKSNLERLFTFVVEQRIQCSVTQQVRYSYTRQQVLALPVPMDPAIQERFEEQQQLVQQEQQRKKRHGSSGDGLREDEAAAAEEDARDKATASFGSEKETEAETEPSSLPTYNFSDCIAAFLAPTLLTDYHSSATGKRGEAVKQMRLASFPPYLVVQLKRFFADQHWQAKKLYCPVLVPEEVGVENMRGFGLQEGEVALPEEENLGSKRRRDEDFAAGSSLNSGSTMQFDPELLSQLTSMGFTENACKRACLAVQSSSPDACVEWIMAHLNDQNLNDPLPTHEPSAPAGGASAAGSTPDPGAEAVITAITSMGFTEKQARAGLLAVSSASGGNSGRAAACDRAADWLLNHSDNLDAAVEAVLREAEEKKEAAERQVRLQQQVDAAGATAEQAESNIPPLQKMMKGLDDGGSQYSLHAFITHIGKNASCGHYVGHVKRGDKWILFNDEKVAEAVNPPVDLGYIYVFRRKDLQ